MISPVMQAIHGCDVYDGFVLDRPVDLQGWNSTDVVLDKLVQKHRPRVIIDVGVWKGASTLHFARLLRDGGIDGVVIAVDTFLGSPEHFDFEKAHLPGRVHGRPALYEQFLTNVVQSGLQEYVVPLPQTSTNAVAILSRLGISAGLVHIDAAHDYESVLYDARAYWALLGPGGILVGDDYTTAWPDVIRAADHFAAEVGCELVNANPKWVVRKPNATAPT